MASSGVGSLESGPCRPRVGVVGEAVHAGDLAVAVAAAQAGGASAVGAPARVEAEELAQEADRLHRVLAEEVALADREQLAEEDAVAAVPGALEPGHARPQQRAVEARRVGHVRLRGLREQEARMVRLVPERPEVDRREAPAGGLGEAPELRGARAVDPEGVAARLGREAGHRRAEREHHAEAGGLRVRHGRGERREARVVGRVAAVEPAGLRAVRGATSDQVSWILIASTPSARSSASVASRGGLADADQLLVGLEDRELLGARLARGREQRQQQEGERDRLESHVWLDGSGEGVV